MVSFVWKVLAALALVLAALATVLPVLPSIPFLMLAAVAAERGWPWLSRRLAAHPSLGPLLRAWKERGALPGSVRVMVLVGLAISGATAWMGPGPVWLPIGVDLALLAVAGWVWARPVA